MATWQVALVREQGVSFGVVSVQDSVLDSPTQRQELSNRWTIKLGCPAVLLGARRHKLFGRSDIVRFLERIDPARLPWKQLSVAA
jgi:hypothetical protein